MGIMVNNYQILVLFFAAITVVQAKTSTTLSYLSLETSVPFYRVAVLNVMGLMTTPAFPT